MQIFVNEQAIKNRISFLKSKNKSIGFVPTMGALHDGHIALMKESINQCDITICSIFVNPTQFNNKEDLIKYPNTIESDLKKLRKVGVDIVFYPTEKVIYPKNLDLSVNLDLEKMDEKWEGEFRAGHFKGVVQVVKRLLDIATPNFLFMGQKDFQQFTIIQMMLNKLKIPTKLVVVPIFREKDGLAMSSRNVRLTSDFRSKSPIIYKALNYAKDNYLKLPITEIESNVLNLLEVNGLKPEYFKIVNGIDLEVVNVDNDKYVIAIVAAWAGDIRLIDNIIIKK